MVKPIIRVLGLGFLLWLGPFLVSVAIYPLKSSDVQFFDTILSVVLVLFCIVFAAIYFKKVTSEYVKRGIEAGVLWLAISLFLDLLMFSWGPMAMPLINYLGDIGLGYLAYPVILVGMGYAVEKKNSGI